MRRSSLWKVSVSLLLLLPAVGCFSETGSTAQVDESGEREFREAWKAYQQSLDPGDKLGLATEFLDRHPGSPHTVQLVNAVTRDCFGSAVKDAQGAVEFAQSRFAGLTDESQIALARRTLLRLYGKAGMGDAIAGVADELGSEASLSDRTEVVEAAAAAEVWGLVEAESQKALDLLTPEYLRGRSGSEDLDDAQVDFELRMRRSDLHRYLGEARFRQGAVSEALKEYESADQNEIRNFIGLGFTPLDELWGAALLAAGEGEKAMEVLERPALIGRNENAQALYRKAYVASGRPEGEFDRFCGDRRLEVAPVIPGFEARDYSGQKVAYDSVKGEVTLLAFWFPT
jgi:tetratricopeptide (TPR) repeat protein